MLGKYKNWKINLDQLLITGLFCYYDMEQMFYNASWGEKFDKHL